MGFISKSIFEDILSLVLQNRFAVIEPMSDPQNEALFEILNPEDVFAIIPTSTYHGKSIIFQCLPDLCRELFLRRFPYPSNAVVVVVCPLNSLVKPHIRELEGQQQNELIFYFRGQNETDYNRISTLFNTITDNI